jgi:hypothetical protein
MKVIDQVILALETFVEMQHENVLECIPDPSRESYSNNWKVHMAESAVRYDAYRQALDSVRKSRSVQNVPRDLLNAVFEHIDTTEGN